MSARPGAARHGCAVLVDPRPDPVGRVRRVHHWESADHALPCTAAVWTSAPVPLDRATTLVPSWEADAPEGSGLDVDVRVAHGDDDGATRWGPWVTVARWSSHPTPAHPRTSLSGAGTHQVDGLDRGDGLHSAVDEVEVPAGTDRAQVRVHLHGGAVLRRVHLLATGSRHLARRTEPSGIAHRIPVPALSQMALGEGGRSWCSPTSITMVLQHWGRVPAGRAAVMDAVLGIVDRAEQNTGNWAFATAYAAQHDLRAFVTRLDGLDDVETLTRAGVPVVISVAFGRDDLDGAGYATSGHLLVVTGFDEHGDVHVNDPAAHEQPDDDLVPTTYAREQLAAVWLDHSGGIAYVVHPADHELPPPPPGRGGAW